MLLELEKKISEFLTSLECPLSGSNILLAVSGGADSIALLHVLHALLSQDVFHAKLYCAHINHQLRHDADNDEEFVISQAEKLNIPVTTKHIDVRGYASDRKLSIETAARQLRIENLVEIAAKNNCSLIATGHQKNDNAETIIHRLLRGTGFRGLAGIWPLRRIDKNVCLLRPLLCVTRDEIIKYLRQKNLCWQEDYTNSEFKYTRNRIRHKLIPALQKECKDSLVEQLSDLALRAERLHRQIYTMTEKLWNDISNCNDKKVMLVQKILQSQLPIIQIELIRKALSCIGCGERDLTSDHYENILQLINQNSIRKIIRLPNEFLVHLEQENIVFKHCRVELAPPVSSRSRFINGGVDPHPTIISIPGTTIFNDFTIQASFLKPEESDLKEFLKSKTPLIEWFDLDKIKLPLTVRFRKPGDKFTPFGQKHEKKIGKFLTAQHIPEEIRNETLIIADSEKIIWLWPVRISEQTRITPQTRKFLELKIEPA